MVAARACHAPHEDAAGRERHLTPVVQVAHTQKPLRCSRHSNSSGNVGAKSHATNSGWPKNVLLQKGHTHPKAKVGVVREHYPRRICLYARMTFCGKSGRRRGRLQRTCTTIMAITITAMAMAMAASSTTTTTSTYPTARRGGKPRGQMRRQTRGYRHPTGRECKGQRGRTRGATVRGTSTRTRLLWHEPRQTAIRRLWRC